MPDGGCHLRLVIRATYGSIYAGGQECHAEACDMSPVQFFGQAEELSYMLERVLYVPPPDWHGTEYPRPPQPTKAERGGFDFVFSNY